MNMGSTSVALVGVCMIGMIGFFLESVQCGNTTAIHVAVQVTRNNGLYKWLYSMNG